MGLDVVEYIMALESTFGIDIADADVAQITTPRQLIDYLASRLPLATADVPESGCRTQHAFYQARGGVERRFGIDRRVLRPETELSELLGERSSEWRDLGADLRAPTWPRLYRREWWASGQGGVRTMGELARHLALHDAHIPRNPGRQWTRREIEVVALQLLEHETGVEMFRFTLDSQFTRDMGLN